jgi:hypothetical protein
MNSEFKRMLELAGLAEIKVNEPKRFTSIKLPYLSLDTDILIPNDDFEEIYGDLVHGLVKLNPQIDSQFFRADDDGLAEDVLEELTKYPEGTTLIEFYKIYFYWLFRNLVFDYGKYEDEEVDERYDEFDQYTDEFAENAIKGRWLNIKTVTAK